MKLSPHFALSEFDCHDGTPVPSGLVFRVKQLALQLERVREYFGGKPVAILSGYRSPAYNRSVGGVKASQHLLGTAADIDVQGVKPARVADAIAYLISEGRMLPGGLGRYPGFTHYDIRGRNARWSGSK